MPNKVNLLNRSEDSEVSIQTVGLTLPPKGTEESFDLDNVSDLGAFLTESRRLVDLEIAQNGKTLSQSELSDLVQAIRVKRNDMLLDARPGVQELESKLS